MGRALRIQKAGLHYHVRAMCNNGEPRFKQETDFKLLLDTIAHYKTKYGFKLYNYVVMSNHYHLYIQTTKSATISQIMHDINATYSRRYNKQYERKGHLFRERFQDTVIDSDQYAITCLRYICLNPVRAGIVAKPEEYKWSGYHVYAFGDKDVLIDMHPRYIDFDHNEKIRQKIFRGIVENGD